ncbi:MAG: outer membrane lipoprotein LolB [Variovorax sp.]
MKWPARCAAAIVVGALLAGCAAPANHADRPTSPTVAEAWSGRLALRIDTDPQQSFSALFDLRGTPQAGELTLTTPIGNTLAVLQWSPGLALLKNGNQTQRYESVDALIEAATGAAIPVKALFAWLAGREEAVAGWQADLSQFGAGRLQATRRSPPPAADLRVAFERP